MENGTYDYYAIQQRRRAESPWAKPDEPIKEISVGKRGDWNLCGDFWSRSTNVHVGTGNNWHPQNRKADQEWHGCYHKTGQHGWWTLEYAIAAFRHLRKHDDEGMYDSFGSYRDREQAVRHEFRLVRIHLVHERQITPVATEELVRT